MVKKFSSFTSHVLTGVPWLTLAVLTLSLSAGCTESKTEAETKKPVESKSVGHGIKEDGKFPTTQLLKTIREESVFREKIDWAVVEAETTSQIQSAESDADIANAVVGLFKKMNDVHSTFNLNGKSYTHYEGLDENARNKLLPLMNLERKRSGQVEAKLINEDIGYVFVPTMRAYTTEQINVFSKNLYDSVIEVMRQNPDGWIVDLRLNGGGNLMPMLVGLRPLLGDGVVGGTVDSDDRKVHDWVLKSDGLYWRDTDGDRRFAELDMGAQVPNPSVPIVVLVGPTTRSSGQAVALSFRNRQKSLLLGEATARGYTTVTAPFDIGANASLSLAVGYMADRNGEPCKVQLIPEKIVSEGDDFESLLSDRKITAAIEWLRGRAE